VIRDSGITARFLADHKSEDVQRESGHEHISTTLGYAKEVKNRQGRYGVPFAPLPAALIDPSTPKARLRAARLEGAVPNVCPMAAAPVRSNERSFSPPSRPVRMGVSMLVGDGLTHAGISASEHDRDEPQEQSI